MTSIHCNRCVTRIEFNNGVPWLTVLHLRPSDAGWRRERPPITFVCGESFQYNASDVKEKTSSHNTFFGDCVSRVATRSSARLGVWKVLMSRASSSALHAGSGEFTVHHCRHNVAIHPPAGACSTETTVVKGRPRRSQTRLDPTMRWRTIRLTHTSISRAVSGRNVATVRPVTERRQTRDLGMPPTEGCGQEVSRHRPAS